MLASNSLASHQLLVSGLLLLTSLLVAGSAVPHSCHSWGSAPSHTGSAGLVVSPHLVVWFDSAVPHPDLLLGLFSWFSSLCILFSILSTSPPHFVFVLGGSLLLGFVGIVSHLPTTCLCPTVLDFHQCRIISISTLPISFPDSSGFGVLLPCVSFFSPL